MAQRHMLTHSQRDGMLVCEAGQRVGGLGLLLANAFLAALYWLVASGAGYRARTLS